MERENNTLLLDDAGEWFDAVQDWKAERQDILRQGTTADELRSLLDALGNKPRLVRS